MVKRHPGWAAGRWLSAAFRPCLRRAAAGHTGSAEHRRLVEGHSHRYEFRKETIAGMRRNGRDAPFPVIRGTTVRLRGCVETGRSAASPKLGCEALTRLIPPV